MIYFPYFFITFFISNTSFLGLSDKVTALEIHKESAPDSSAFFALSLFIPPIPTMGNLNLEDIEQPFYADPEPWLYSLAYQQFTPEEFANGTAVEILLDKGFM